MIFCDFNGLGPILFDTRLPPNEHFNPVWSEVNYLWARNCPTPLSPVQRLQPLGGFFYDYRQPIALALQAVNCQHLPNVLTNIDGTVVICVSIRLETKKSARSMRSIKGGCLEQLRRKLRSQQAGAFPA